MEHEITLLYITVLFILPFGTVIWNMRLHYDILQFHLRHQNYHTNITIVNISFVQFLCTNKQCTFIYDS